MILKYLFGLLLLAEVIAILQVYAPACAASRFAMPIQYTLSNFGEIPYGETLIGQITLPSNQLLCSTDNQPVLKSQDASTKKILLVKRGQCKFTKKVINAQNLGADIIIIYDDSVGDTPNVVMKNDGHGHLAKIPSLFISHTDGLKLFTKDSNCDSLPIVKVEFEIDQANVSHVTLWLDANNRESYILARDFHKNKYYSILQDRINLDIRFRVQDSCQDWLCDQNDCIGTKPQKYCRFTDQGSNPYVPLPSGSKIIQEQLRQYFLWQKLRYGGDKTKWWKYMSKFDQQICMQYQDIKDCSINIMKKVEISDDIINSIDAAINQTLNQLSSSQPTILKETSYESKQMGIYFYPEATINNRNFYGLFKAPEVFDAICDSLIDPPSGCSALSKNNEVDQSSSIVGTILIILLVMTIGFFIALFIYTRIIRREVNQQLSLEVNKMVENYVNLAQKSKSSESYSKI